MRSFYPKRRRDKSFAYFSFLFEALLRIENSYYLFFCMRSFFFPSHRIPNLGFEGKTKACEPFSVLCAASIPCIPCWAYKRKDNNSYPFEASISSFPSHRKQLLSFLLYAKFLFFRLKSSSYFFKSKA